MQLAPFFDYVSLLFQDPKKKYDPIEGATFQGLGKVRVLGFIGLGCLRQGAMGLGGCGS